MKKGFAFLKSKSEDSQYDLSSIIKTPQAFALFVSCFDVNKTSLLIDKILDRNGNLVSIGSIRFPLPNESTHVYLNYFLDPSDIISQWEISKTEEEWSERKLLRIAMLGQVGFGGLYLGCGELNNDEIWIFNAESKPKYIKISDSIFEFIKRLEFSTDFSNIDDEEYEELYKKWSEEFWRKR